MRVLACVNPTIARVCIIICVRIIYPAGRVYVCMCVMYARVRWCALYQYTLMLSIDECRRWVIPSSARLCISYTRICIIYPAGGYVLCVCVCGVCGRALVGARMFANACIGECMVWLTHPARACVYIIYVYALYTQQGGVCTVCMCLVYARVRVALRIVSQPTPRTNLCSYIASQGIHIRQSVINQFLRWEL